jgi:8-oxo-dGTP diphosphatase
VEPLRVVAAAVLDARRLLLVSKRAAPDVFYLPGGKPEPGEAPLDCLRRELGEELGVGLRAAEPLADVRAPAALEGVPMAMTVFLTEIDGTPAPEAEIASLAWWPDGRALALAPAVRDHVVPRLRRAGRLAP